MAIEVNCGAYEGHSLGDNGSQGGTVGAHAEDCHEDQVQHQVDDGGDEDKQHGQLALAHAPEDGAHGVIAEDEHHADAADNEVVHGVVPGLSRGVQQVQQGSGEDYTQNHGGKAQYQFGGEQGADGALQVLVLHAYLLRNQHLTAIGEAHADAQEHVGQLTADAHGGKTRGPHELAHHYHIHHVIHGLEYVGQHYGQGEEDKLLHHRTAGHVFHKGFAFVH